MKNVLHEKSKIPVKIRGKNMKSRIRKNCVEFHKMIQDFEMLTNLGRYGNENLGMKIGVDTEDFAF